MMLGEKEDLEVMFTWLSISLGILGAMEHDSLLHLLIWNIPIISYWSYRIIRKDKIPITKILLLD